MASTRLSALSYAPMAPLINALPISIAVTLFAAIVLGGCAAAPGIVQAPDGTFTAMRRGTELAAATGPLRMQALKDADDYCAARKKSARVLRTREIPAIAHWPEALVSFVCE